MVKKIFQPTEEQQKILDIKEGLHLVLAPPGSGKTELLAHRVYNAKKVGIKDSDIICLTFTSRAARGMKDKIFEKYPENEIIIGNIHRYCSLFLFRNNLIPLNTSILDEEDSEQIIEELKRSLNYNHQVYNPILIKLATYLKQKELGFPNELFLKPKASEIPEPLIAKEVCEAYNIEKVKNNYLDFDDLLTLTYYHLTQSNNTLKLSQFKWLQVDEIQDLNPLQWAIIQKIVTSDSLVVYFGDYEQAIFSFMGAKLDSLHNIEKNVKNNPKNAIHNLQKNFRSPSYLLDIYVRFAETQWKPSWKKPPIPELKQSAPEKSLMMYEIPGKIYDEANYISQKIIPNILNETEKTAIIVRFNKSADYISSSLQKASIPHFKISGFDVFRRKSVKGLMAFLSIILNELDRLSWARILYELEIILTLKESRNFVNELTSKGLTLIDIIEYNGKSSRLGNFFNILSSKEIIIFDTETTGLDTAKDDIIQIAAIKLYEGQIIDTFEIYINTEIDVTSSESIHHISKKHLNELGVPHSKGLKAFLEFIGENSILIAHNIGFDYSILNSNLQRFCGTDLTNYCSQKFDSITISKLIYPNFPSYKLKELIEFLKLEGVNSHNAMDDVKATAELIKKLQSEYLENIEKNQTTFLSNAINKSIIEKFNSKFKELYSLSECQFDKTISLNQIAELYLNYIKNKFIPKDETKMDKWLKDWADEMTEIDKLLKHTAFYTKESAHLTLKQKIAKYIPEYRNFKESDLYIGIEKVVISTVYKAKGLEFDNVIVAETTDDNYPMLWPLANSTEEEKRNRILEDARAFYVAMTRSKKKLFFTSSTQAKNGKSVKESRFKECISPFFKKVNITNPS